MIATLKKGKEKPVLNFHPWIFSGAIQSVDGEVEKGGVVKVYSSKNQYLATGFFSPDSQIRIRLLSWDEEEIINQRFFQNRIKKAYTSRIESNILKHTNAIRILHGESDGLPGLIVDMYDDLLVVQISNWGIDVHLAEIISALKEVTGRSSIYERSDLDIRRIEGMPSKKGWIEGGTESIEKRIHENDLKFIVPFVNGHKTGYYLDQRDSRLKIRELAFGKNVLDCFSYTGGFAVNAAFGGAKTVTLVDSSVDALAIAKRNFEVNEIDLKNVFFETEDVFTLLRKYRDQGREFDMIILDPPKFAPTRAHAEKAARGYKDINLLAFKLLTPGGLLATFSCSGGISSMLFQKIVAGAAVDAGITPQIVDRYFQDSDHPVGLNFPEGDYLKGLLCKK